MPIKKIQLIEDLKVGREYVAGADITSDGLTFSIREVLDDGTLGLEMVDPDPEDLDGWTKKEAQ